MIDFHSHVLPGIDDGSSCVEESLDMLRIAKSQGVITMLATPHFYAQNNSVGHFLKDREKSLNKLKACTEYMKDDVYPDIKLGAEVCYFNGIGQARYIGNEVNMIVKDSEKVDIRFAMCFPDVYEIGMSHLGIQILYDMFNRREDTYCERVYSPWLDLDKIMREKDIPLFAIESQEPIKKFDFLGITLQYEMCYTNILQILDLSKIPLIATERGEDDPIVIGGGPCSYNPEPIADFFDMFYIGEGETQYDELLDIYKENKKNGGSRKEFLEKAAHLSNIFNRRCLYT